MRRKSSVRVTIALASALAFRLGIVDPVEAKEIWVSPSHLVPSVPPALNLAWPLTSLGVAVFGFSVPDDMARFGTARIVMLPASTASGAYSAFAEVKRGGEVVSVFDVEAQQACLCPCPRTPSPR